MSECKIPNPNRDIRDDLGQKHQCQKCKPFKTVLALLTFISIGISLLCLLTPPRVVYVERSPVIKYLLSPQQSISSISSSDDNIDVGKGEETIRTGGNP
jgi:hypothetical protein